MRLRKLCSQPWHSPPHRKSQTGRYHIIAACYRHQHFIGASAVRLTEFTHALLVTLRTTTQQIHAWTVLPNHYHALVTTADILPLLSKLGQLHGRTSYQWNGEDGTRGRQVWCKAAETSMKSERHFWATLNYVHHNPVRHGYVARWQDWPFSSAHDYLDAVGLRAAGRVWKEYPVLDYGREWDPVELGEDSG